jgi:hypothetical protein
MSLFDHCIEEVGAGVVVDVCAGCGLSCANADGTKNAASSPTSNKYLLLNMIYVFIFYLLS